MRARIHFVGVSGKGTAPIALALVARGCRVTGSDEGAYPPMSDLLAAGGLAITSPFDAVQVPADVELVVTAGPRVSMDNPEVRAARARGVPVVSFSRLLHDRLLDRSHNLVVTGGVGKTSTSAMLTWILEQAGRAPDYLVGGVPAGMALSARFNGAAWAVLEGDEYAAAADDPTPKFHYFRPRTLIITNTLDDHPDLYPDRDSLVCVFTNGARLVPAGGCVVLNDEDPATDDIAAATAADVIRVGERATGPGRIDDVTLSSDASRFALQGTPFTLGVFGRMNIRNAAMAALGAAHAGVSLTDSAAALASFREVANRQDRADLGSLSLVRDKATHPVSIRELHGVLRQKYPQRRLVVAIRPRATGGREWIYQRDLPSALALFDAVLITAPYEHRPPARTRWHDTPFSVDQLVTDTRARGGDVTIDADRDLPAALLTLVEDDDVVLLLLPESQVAEAAAVVAALTERHAAVPGRT